MLGWVAGQPTYQIIAFVQQKLDFKSVCTHVCLDETEILKES